MYEENSLEHAGIKGMKWGVRRFQNPDGTLTEAGKKRYDRDTRNMKDKEKAKYKADPDKWVKEDMESGRKLANEANTLTKQLGSQVDKSIKNQKRPKVDLSNMTDQEMRSQINRAALERQYIDEFYPAKVSKGKVAVKKTLEVAGDVLAVTATSLAIATAIKELRS